MENGNRLLSDGLSVPLSVTTMITLLVVVLGLSFGTFGANDWTKACLDGMCSFDVKESPTSMGGTIEISGSSSAISDLTPAAGWQILNCSDNTNSQTIRLVCTDESPESSCEHVFQNGAQDTIVRLPEDCGSGPFVRVVNHSISDDQSLPDRVVSRLARRDGSTHQVHAFELDDTFNQISGIHGNVSFEIRAQGNLRHNSSSGAVPSKFKRQNDSASAFEDVNMPGQSFTLFNPQMTCPAADDTTQTQTVSTTVILTQTVFFFAVNVTSTGTLTPPNIDSLLFSAPTDGLIEVGSDSQAGLQGTVTVSEIELTGQEFPSFSIDGVLTINPVFQVVGNVELTAELLSNFEPFTDFSVDINSLQFTYPSNGSPASVNIEAQESPISALAIPVQNSTAQFSISVLYQLIAIVTAFSQSVDLGVSFNYGTNLSLVSSPSAGNMEEVCVEFASNFAIEVANSGAFFDAFSDASSQFIFSNSSAPLSACQNLSFGASSEVAPRTKRSTLFERDGLSCPPVAPLPQDILDIFS